MSFFLWNQRVYVYACVFAFVYTCQANQPKKEKEQRLRGIFIVYGKETIPKIFCYRIIHTNIYVCVLFMGMPYAYMLTPIVCDAYE